jgi:hypothetical protein
MLPWVMKMQEGLEAEKTAGCFYQLLVTLLGALLRFIGTIAPRG